MRTARVVRPLPAGGLRHRPHPGASRAPALVLAAHGSRDPRSAHVAQALAGRIRRLRPALEVHAAFLEQSGPRVVDVLSDAARRRQPAVVVPMLLASAYHARVDLPAAIEASGAMVQQADVLGEDPALVTLLGLRLAESGVSADQRELGVIVVAVGSSNRQCPPADRRALVSGSWSTHRSGRQIGCRPWYSNGATLGFAQSGGRHPVGSVRRHPGRARRRLSAAWLTRIRKRDRIEARRSVWHGR